MNDSRAAKILRLINVDRVDNNMFSESQSTRVQKNLPEKEGENVLTFTKEDGRVWTRYKHEHDSMLHLVYQETIDKLKHHFSIINRDSQPAEDLQIAELAVSKGDTSQADDSTKKAQVKQMDVIEEEQSSHSYNLFTKADINYILDSDDSEKDPDFDVKKCGDNLSSDEENFYKKKSNFKTKSRLTKMQVSVDHSLPKSDEITPNILSETEAVQPLAKKGKRKIADPSTWKRSKAKKLRNEGKEYVQLKGKRPIKAREVKPSCLEKCVHKCKEKFTEEERKTLFDRFWELGDVTKQREYITRHSNTINPEYRYPQKNPRQLNHAFYFYQGENKKRVCKTFFMATLDITRRTIATAFKKEVDGVIRTDLRGKHNNHPEVPAEIKEGIKVHINSIPRIESHYLRRQTSREYIEGGKSIAGLYRDYKKQCEDENKTFGSLSMYTHIFNYDYNISFYVPKKDQCETCTVYNLADEEKKENLKSEYYLHLEEKELARQEKKWDKEFSNDNVIVCCYDLQAAFPTPQGEASLFYYKSKLSSYNLSIYNIKTGEAVNYVWHEGDANRGANEIATCVYKFIEENATSTDKRLKFIFYSDNCSGQQKNKYVFVMYMLCLRRFKNIDSISHKFLVTGHTQNEGDCVHSVIEKAVKRARKSGPIYVPSQFVQIIRTAKVSEPFYVVKELSFNDILDFKNLTSFLGSNFNVNSFKTKFSFSEIKSFIIKKENPFQFYYRTSFDTELGMVDIFFDSSSNILPQAMSQSSTNVRRTRNRKSYKNDIVEDEDPQEKRLKILDEWDCKKAYGSPTGISQNKKNDLLSLINSGVVPETYRKFYENLPIRKLNKKKRPLVSIKEV